MERMTSRSFREQKEQLIALRRRIWWDSQARGNTAEDHNRSGQRSFGTRGDESRLLDRIERAMERIEDGDYGRCQKCGGRITSSRLRAIPYSELCTPCRNHEQRNHEQ